MRALTIQIAIAALCACVAFAQAPADLDRVFHFTNAETAQAMQEIATVIRAMTEMTQVSADTAQKTLAVRGTAGQIALADWLFNELDKPPQQTPDTATHEYKLPDSGEIVRVFYLTHTETVRDLQEVATVVRSIGTIRRMFTYNAPRAVAMRGTAEQVALAEWLFNELNQPVKQRPDAGPHEYRVPGARDDVVGVFYLTHAPTLQRFQEIATHVRSTTEVRRLFTYNAPRAVALRGTAEQLAMAGRLIKESDR